VIANIAIAVAPVIREIALRMNWGELMVSGLCELRAPRR